MIQKAEHDGISILFSLFSFKNDTVFIVNYLPYKKIGKKETLCIANEVPLELPYGWDRCRFKDVIPYSSLSKQFCRHLFHGSPKQKPSHHHHKQRESNSHCRCEKYCFSESNICQL